MGYKYNLRKPMSGLRSEKIWWWRCQWSIVTLTAIVLVVYNAAANIWLLRPQACPAAATPPPGEPVTCEPCGDASGLGAGDDDPVARIDLRLGRWDGSRSYKMFDYAAVGDLYAELSAERRVCLATQSSIERLHELLRIAAHWSGPISVAVFVAGDELKLLRAFAMWMFRCQPETFMRIALHIVTPAEKPGIQGNVPNWARDCEAKPLPSYEIKTDTMAWRVRHPYPQNHLRNLARKNCQTPYVFLVDVDIVPSRGMSEALDSFLAKAPTCPLCAYVVPTYELDLRVATFPANKSELLRLSRKKLAIPFHRKVFIYNQYASNFTRWEATGGNESEDAHVSHNVTNFELLYEPFYVAPDTAPAHDERFLGYGFTRNTQVMSFYYLTPVKGDMPAHLLEAIITKRLDFLKAVSKGETTEYNEYVIEGSVYDNAGHFALCIVTILTGNPGFTQFFLKAETELFKRRLKAFSAYDIRRFAKRLLNNIRRKDDSPYFTPLQILCQHLILKNLAQHVCSTHNSNCSLHSIQLGFKDCLTFVARRQVELKNGIAELCCGRWLEYFISLFNTNIRYRIANTDVTPLKNDPRITDLLIQIKKDLVPFVSHSNSNSNSLLSKNVDNLSQFFPPCMLNLHRTLRSKHRLSHTQRFFYSLFLKDIGMPLDEAIDFWRLEYRLNPNGTHVCCHSWEKDGKKYLYGIRHMYGLEGGRKNYTSVNCQRIQGVESACSEGGCPFKSFDYPKMLPLLNGCSESVLSQINELRRRGHYMSACRTYLQKNSNDCDSASFNFTPVKYYMIASNHGV